MEACRRKANRATACLLVGPTVDLQRAVGIVVFSPPRMCKLGSVTRKSWTFSLVYNHNAWKSLVAGGQQDESYLCL
jgi:hypothetical protein